MDEIAKYRLFIALALPLFVMFSFRARAKQESDSDRRPSVPRYNTYVYHYHLPVMLTFFLLVLMFAKDLQRKIEIMSLLLDVFLHITLYYVLLALAIPVLRRYISSRVCAALWLLPNVFYFSAYLALGVRKPFFTLYVPAQWLSSLLWMWLAGVVAVLVWKFAGHFRFREQLMAEAWPEEDPWIVGLWEEELKRAGYDQWFDIVRSPMVSTPFTIGFFAGTIRVVLPDRAYTPEELQLILRHEVIHIGRQDAVTKLMLTLCAAMCWFNPLMWWAMRKSADDLELSCDETLLLGADESRRRKYAELLLRTAGEERGFTTCLSASAKSLRYRLHWVMRPRKQFTGGLIAGLITAALLLTSGSVALAFERGTGEKLIFLNRPHGEFTVSGEAKWLAPDGNYALGVLDPAALSDYLARLYCEQIADNYDIFQNYSPEYRLAVKYDGPDGSVNVYLTDHVMTVSGEKYYVPEKIDWLYLESLLEGHA